MKSSVRQAFWDFNVRFEGWTNWMYLDVLGLVTTGVGNLIDPVDYALALPWKRHGVDGFQRVSPSEIKLEWNRCKSQQDKAKLGGGYFKNQAQLFLHDDDVKSLVFGKLDQVWKHLTARFPDAVSWPADAQLGLLSMAWAMGPGFNFPSFRAAASGPKPDFFTAAKECKISEKGNPGVIPRNAANLVLFKNAGHVVQHEWEREILWYPKDLCSQPFRPVSGPGIYSVKEDIVTRPDRAEDVFERPEGASG